jgi:hypothetical protein
MFSIIKLLIGLVALVLFVWFGANVPLGSRTLFEHLQAIGRTTETRNLAQPLVDGVRRISDGVSKSGLPLLAPPDAGAPPEEKISDTDRQRLRQVLGRAHPTR